MKCKIIIESTGNDLEAIICAVDIAKYKNLDIAGANSGHVEIIFIDKVLKPEAGIRQ